MNNYLITWHANWADEFDIFGINILTHKQRKLLLDALLKYSKDLEDSEIDLYFGINEYISYKPSELYNIIKLATPLIETEYLVLSKFFSREDGQEFISQIIDILSSNNYLNQEEYYDIF